MVKLSEIELQVLARINASPDGQILREVLTKRLAACDAANRKLDGPELHRSQGRAQELALLLDDLTGARETVEKLQASDAGRARQRVTWNPGQ